MEPSASPAGSQAQLTGSNSGLDITSAHFMDNSGLVTEKKFEHYSLKTLARNEAHHDCYYRDPCPEIRLSEGMALSQAWGLNIVF